MGVKLFSENNLKAGQNPAHNFGIIFPDDLFVTHIV